MSNLREINELLHMCFEEYLKWILLSLFFPAYDFKNTPEALKTRRLKAFPWNALATKRSIERNCAVTVYYHD